jgi:very-short-patch-repair endonuclease
VIGIKEDTLQQIKYNYLREQPNASQLLPGSSIYDLARVIFPSQHIMLTEHFRCVEPIIRFSMNFYTEELVPLRIPKSSERLEPPLIDVYVQGGIREKNNINYSEVDAIVEEIKKITSSFQYKGRTIGVISLIGVKQAHEIQNKLLSELGEEVYTAFEIFCGDASRFQGKEKDIIFLSMVVGKDQGMALTKLDNEQRFNVALSRARDRMYLYRSIEESDLKNSDDLKLKVLQHFKNPMPNSNDIKDGLELCDSDFERDVYKRLDSLGYKVIPQVSVGAYSIDLVVEGEHDKRLAIELDGDKYHTPENWLNDWNRQRILERVGWIFWRCWGSDYLLDPNGCIEDLINRLDSLEIYPTDNKEINNIYVEHRVYNITHNPSFKNNADFEEDNEDIENKAPNTYSIEKEPISVILDDKKSLLDDTLTNERTKTDNTSFIRNEIKDNELKQLLINLRDNEISKEFVIDRRCVLSPLMIEQFIKYKPLDRDEFQKKISLRIRQSIDPEQMSFIDDIFEILEMADK